MEDVSILLYKDDIIYYGQRTPGKTWGHRLQFPGGRIKYGETSFKAAKRELKEECGIEAGVLKLVTKHRFRWPHGGVFDCWLYMMQLDTIIYNMEPEKNVGWFMIYKQLITERMMRRFRPPCQYLLRKYVSTNT